MAIDYSVFKFAKGPSRYEQKDAKRKDAEAARRRVYKLVDARDKGCCRICGKPAKLDGKGVLEQGHRHHVQYRSKGGMDTTDNLVLLCAADHRAIHDGKIKLEGNADAPKGIKMTSLYARLGSVVERWI